MKALLVGLSIVALGLVAWTVYTSRTATGDPLDGFIGSPFCERYGCITSNSTGDEGSGTYFRAFSFTSDGLGAGPKLYLEAEKGRVASARLVYNGASDWVFHVLPTGRPNENLQAAVDLTEQLTGRRPDPQMISDMEEKMTSFEGGPVRHSGPRGLYALEVKRSCGESCATLYDVTLME